jgi:hypothetical protein
VVLATFAAVGRGDDDTEAESIQSQLDGAESATDESGGPK